MMIGDFCSVEVAVEMTVEQKNDVKPDKKVVKVGVNELGMRVGESHQRAKLTDHEIDLIHQLLDDAEADKAAGRKYLRDYEIAEKFEISKSHLHNIRHDKERSQVPVKFKVLHQKS